jgi:ABC-type transport system involved in cytochrome bd biosynthesis fused ATPase/permease subunit
MATIFIISLYFGFLSLYATLVCVAGGQLEKLRTALLDMRQTHGTSLQDFGGETDEWEAAGQKNTYSEQFRHMQKKMNNCIRHHQEIKR